MYLIYNSSFLFYSIILVYAYSLLVSSFTIYFMFVSKYSFFKNKYVLVVSSSTISSFIFLMYSYICLLLLTLKCFDSIMIFGHLAINSVNYSLTLLMMLVFVSSISCFNKFFFINSMESSDVILAALFLYFCGCISFLATNLITLVFFIELLSLSIFFLLITSSSVSSFFYKKNQESSSYLDNNFLFLNFFAIITVFWVSLLSSLFFFIAIILLYYLFLSSDMALIDLILSLPILSGGGYLSSAPFYFFLTNAFFLKMALPPFFLWKLVFFKHANLSYIFFYIFNFFLVIIIIFFLITLNSLPLIINSFKYYNLVVLLVGIIAITPVVVSNLNIKIFFALSSSLNFAFSFYLLNTINMFNLIIL